MALWLYMHYYHTLHKRIVWKEIIQRQAMYRFFQVNRDIFFRTLCLVMVTMFFTSAGAAQGEVVLAVNTLLMQLFTLFSLLMPVRRWLDVISVQKIKQASAVPYIISSIGDWVFRFYSPSYIQLAGKAF